MNYMAEAFAPAEAKYRSQVLHATWGHLAATEGVKHPGTILFAHGEYGDIVPLRADFPTVNDSPWFFDAMSDYIDRQVMRRKNPGTIYRFSGYYVLQKNGKGRFSGKVKVVKI